ncbi:DUF5134 domain-containing protein [Amycolatopsis sp. NPDC051372]|uniref:DUF5134 domain-containing protein n=1 Tax=Amycolatopsis sp. NPDC051372 TaxID=3155669 RepID=UPI00341C9415
MSAPVLVAWLLTAVFAVLALPCVLRLVRLDYARLGSGVRNADLAELLLVVAMVAMISPAGGPIPAAGWQAVFVLTAAWFGFAWWRGRGQAHAAHASGCGHHALSAAAMLYMVTAMPHDGMVHGPWLTMSSMDVRLAVPLLAVLGAVYFVADAARSGVVAVRTRGAAAPGLTSRTVCRAVMGAGMGYLLLAAV